MSGGSTNQWRLSRLDADGTVDGSFTPPPALNGNNPPLTGAAGFLYLYPDGRMLFASELRIRRYLPDQSFEDW